MVSHSPHLFPSLPDVSVLTGSFAALSVILQVSRFTEVYLTNQTIQTRLEHTPCLVSRGVLVVSLDL